MCSGLAATDSKTFDTSHNGNSSLLSSYCMKFNRNGNSDMLKRKWIKNVLFFIALALIGAGVIVTLTTGATEGTVVIVTGFGLMVLTQFEWHEIKLLGMEAKLRDTINDAEKVLESLRSVSLPISKVAISLASRTGRMNTATTTNDLYKLVSSISRELEKIGVTPNQLTTIKHDWFYFTTFDMCSIISEKITALLQAHHSEADKKYRQWEGGKSISDQAKQLEMLKLVQDANAEIESFRNILWKKPFQDMSMILKKFIDESKIISASEKQSLLKDNDEIWQDIDYFIKNKEFRRPNIWLSE